jgi:hypothetical protein
MGTNHKKIVFFLLFFLNPWELNQHLVTLSHKKLSYLFEQFFWVIFSHFTQINKKLIIKKGLLQFFE